VQAEYAEPTVIGEAVHIDENMRAKLIDTNRDRS
jgi:hypothetical protein